MPGRKSGSGGYREPSSPAAVSGEGANSARTDGGPSNPRFDLQGFDAEQHGQRQGLEHAAGLTGGGGAPVAPAGGGGALPGMGAELPDVFGPSTGDMDSPLDSMGYQMGLGSVPPDPDLLLRALAANHPHPDLERMLQIRMARPNRTPPTTPRSQTPVFPDDDELSFMDEEADDFEDLPPVLADEELDDEEMSDVGGLGELMGEDEAMPPAEPPGAPAEGEMS